MPKITQEDNIIRTLKRAGTGYVLIGWVLIGVMVHSTFGYDYSELMPGISALPLEYPEKPFVLRFNREELLGQPIWTRQVDGIIIAKGERLWK